MCAVSVEPQILRTKLYPPRLPEIVPRARLSGELEGVRSVKLATIVAGAGYGKSTLAAEFLQKLDSPFVWYQLEDTDGDLPVFLSYLVAGLRSTHPEFGKKTIDHMASASNVREQSRAILSTFITELDELVAEELFIALDDFHLVNESSQITEAMDFLLTHMLPNLHFIVLSRSALSLALTDLKAKRELLELQESDLRFTTEETATLFADIFGMPLALEDIAALFESTEGWVSGLVLFYLALKDKESAAVSKTIRESGMSLSAVFDYLSKEAYETQSELIQDFITKTSVLPRMSPRFCDELLGVDDSRAILSYLMSERLFTIPLDDAGNWYRYHHSLRAFLQTTLTRNLTPNEIEELHLKAAALWEKNGEPEQALYHYVEAESYERAADVLESIIVDLMRANRTSFLYREIARLPEDTQQKHPRLMLYDTQIAAILGDFGRMVAAARAATEGFEEAGEGGKQARSLVYTAGGLFIAGKPDEAREMISKAREAMPPDSPYLQELLATESMISTATGRVGEADAPLEEALRLADESKDTDLSAQLLGWCGTALLAQGRLNKTLEVYLSPNTLLERVGVTATHSFTYAFSSRAYAWLDRLEEAVKTADEGIALGEEHGIAPMVFFNRAARAVAYACLGKRDRALEDASIATSMCSQHEPIILVAYAEYFSGEAYGLTGDTTAALNHLKRAEQMLEKYHDIKYVPKLAFTAFSIQNLGLKRAMEEVQGIIEALKGSGTMLALSLAYSLLFTLKLAANNEKEALEILEIYIKEFGDDIILRSHLADHEHLLSLFTDLFSKGKHLEFMKRVFSLGRTDSVSYLQRLEKSERNQVANRARELLETMPREAVEPLVIRMLGPLEVSRGGHSLSFKDWKSKKALTILKYLSLNRNKGYIPRDVLMELVWPETPVESAQKNLNAALSSLRKTLEPQATRGESSYLLTSGDALMLELGVGGWTDVDLLQEKLAQADKAKEIGDFDLQFQILHEAVALYRGEFCAEDLYENWCQPDREAFRNQYVHLVVNIATEHLRRGEGAEASSHLEKGITKDPGREELYRKQMIIYSQAANRAGIEDTFRRCNKYLWDNYEVSPSLETTELYQRLRKE